MNLTWVSSLSFFAAALLPQVALGVSSAEMYTAESFGYGRVEARLRFASGDGVVSSLFLWKDGSEKAGTFWNELDFEKLGADCHLATNAYYGNPAVTHSKNSTLTASICSDFHTYAYEWTPDAIVWLVDGAEVRRETGATATAYAVNASTGMQIHFNVWPGDASFGGNFSPSILPVHEYIDWVQFSSYANGAFTLAWREDFDSTELSSRWMTGTWASPKNLSTHDPGNVNIINSYAVLSLTTDGAVGPAGATVPGSSGGGTGGQSGMIANGGGNPASGGSSAGASNAGSNAVAAGASNAASGNENVGSSPNATTRDGSGCNIGGSSGSHLFLCGIFLAAAAVWSRRIRGETRKEG